MSEHNHFWGTVPNELDGITYQQCLEDDCGEIAGPVMLSGTGWWKCGEGLTILPRRPMFHDEAKGRAWMRLWIANELQGGGYVDDKAREAA